MTVIALNHMTVDGKPVVLDTAAGTITVAGDEMDYARWLEIRRRIDLLFKRNLSAEDWKALREQLAWLGKRDALPAELKYPVEPPPKKQREWLKRAVHWLRNLYSQDRRYA